MSKGERKQKHAGPRLGRGRKGKLYPGTDASEDFMKNTVGVNSSPGSSGEEVGEAQQEPGKDNSISFLSPDTSGRTLPCIFLYFPAFLAQG